MALAPRNITGISILATTDPARERRTSLTSSSFPTNQQQEREREKKKGVRWTGPSWTRTVEAPRSDLRNHLEAAAPTFPSHALSHDDFFAPLLASPAPALPTSTFVPANFLHVKTVNQPLVKIILKQ